MPWQDCKQVEPPVNTPILVDTYNGVCIMKLVPVGDSFKWMGLYGDYYFINPAFQPLKWHEIPPRDSS